jgi:uncharacterized protein (DUF433 family)
LQTVQVLDRQASSGGAMTATQPEMDLQSTPYDPATEHDPLISQRIVRSPVSGQPIFRGPIPYPVGAIVEQLRATAEDRVAVLQSFPELSQEDLDAAKRFWHLHGDEIRDHLV